MKEIINENENDECKKCNWFDRELGYCTCASWEAWYQCPIKMKTLEGQKELEDYANWVEKQR